jgi:hypothetical protein
MIFSQRAAGIKHVQQKENNEMKHHFLLGVLLALTLVACQPIQPAATMPQQATTQLTDEDKIANAMSAAPLSIAQDAAVIDWPIDPTLGVGKELRAGTNGWVCRPDDPTTPTNDPRCLDANWLKVFGMEFGPEREAQVALGVAYMLQGDSVADNDDPSALQPPPGQEWQIDPPHIMVVSPRQLDLALYSTDHHSGGPWVMFGGTPAEHLMAPVEEVASVEVGDKVANAMSAGPASISQDAAVMDWPAESGGDLVELREGSNGWTCLPDDPTTPTNDPMCLDAMWLAWLKAGLAGIDRNVTAIGFAYMLQGGSVADNNDPTVMEPPAGQEWQIDPPHMMIISPDDLDPAVYSTDPHAGGPWIMFEGTPAEHLMVPVTESSH